MAEDEEENIDNQEEETVESAAPTESGQAAQSAQLPLAASSQFLPPMRNRGVKNYSAYLTSHDFGGAPTISNETYFPSENKGVLIGNSTGKYIGSHPIFSGEGSLVPLGVIDARERALNDAAYKQKLFQMQQEEAAKTKLNSIYNFADLKNPLYDQKYYGQMLGGAQEIQQDALRMSGGSFTKANQIIFNPKTTDEQALSSRYFNHIATGKMFKDNSDWFVKQDQEATKAEAEGKIVIPMYRETMNEFNSGKMDLNSPQGIQKAMTTIHTVKNVNDSLFKYVSAFKQDQVLHPDGSITTNTGNADQKERFKEGLREFVQSNPLSYAVSAYGEDELDKNKVGNHGDVNVDAVVDKLAPQLYSLLGKTATKGFNEEAGKKKQWQRSGNTIQNDKNVWSYNASPQGNETITFSHTNPSENNAMDFTDARGQAVTGIPLRFESYINQNGEQNYNLIINKKSTSTEHVDKNTGKVYSDAEVNAMDDFQKSNLKSKTVTESSEEKIPYTPYNADKIKNEYGKNPFEVKDEISGSLSKPNGAKTGQATNTTGKAAQQSTPTASREDWIKAGWTDAQIDQALKLNKISVK